MSKSYLDAHWADLRQAVFTRDQHQCGNCLGTIDDDLTLDPDHNVPRGAGGSDRLTNLNTLCRQCHDAKHGNGIAPTVELKSTGQMSSVEFDWFRHFLQEMVPAQARVFNVRLIPKFGLADNDAWYLPLGDLRRLDQQLLEADDQYSSLQAHQYM